jgi:hypothetical protein
MYPPPWISISMCWTLGSWPADLQLHSLRYPPPCWTLGSWSVHPQLNRSMCRMMVCLVPRLVFNTTCSVRLAIIDIILISDRMYQTQTPASSQMNQRTAPQPLLPRLVFDITFNMFNATCSVVLTIIDIGQNTLADNTTVIASQVGVQCYLFCCAHNL